MGKIGFQKARQNLKVGVVCSIINFEHIMKNSFLSFLNFVRWTSKAKIKGSKKGQIHQTKENRRCDSPQRYSTQIALFCMRTKSNRKLTIQLTYVDYEKLGIFQGL